MLKYTYVYIPHSNNLNRICRVHSNPYGSDCVLIHNGTFPNGTLLYGTLHYDTLQNGTAIQNGTATQNRTVT
jgi:hypothetical protein